MTNLLADLYLALRDLAEPVSRRFGSLEGLEYLFYRYGWEISLDAAAFGKIDGALEFKAPLEEFLSAADSLKQQLTDAPDASVSLEVIGKVGDAARALISAMARVKSSSLTGVPAPLDDPAFWTSIGEQLFDDLLEEYLRIYHPPIYLALHVGGVIRYDPVESSGAFRRPYSRTVFDWDQVSALLRDPLGAVKQTYKWGDATAPLEYERLFDALGAVLRAIHLPTRTIAPSLRTASGSLPEDSDHKVQSDAAGLGTTFLDSFSPRDQTVYEIGLEMFPAARAGATVPSGIVFSPILRGGAAGDLPLGKSAALRWKLAATADDAIGVAVFPDTVGVIRGDLLVGASLEIAGTATDPTYLFGNAHGARMELYCPSARLSVDGTIDDPEVTLRLGVNGTNGQPGCKVVLLLDDADSFVKDTVSASSLEFSFSPEVVWSTKSGIRFNGNPKVDIRVPLAIGLGPVTLTGASVSVDPAPETPSGSGGWVSTIGVNVVGKLGPVTVVVQELGLACTVVPSKREDLVALPPGARAPTLGALDVDFRFAPPNGLGVSVDSGIVSGGGFIGHKGDEYSGALDLLVADLAVKAYGVLQTKLPGGQLGYSFVVALSAEFAPSIQLAFGFSLDGIGGLVGINRTVSIEAVETGLWGHQLDGLLFPKDPVATAPQLVAALDSYFPAAKGRYLFGPLVKIGWGGDIVTGELALLLEVPEPLRILLLGEIQMAVPAVLPQLEVHISFAGGLDFGKKLAFFDASLHDSRIESYPISGDMAFRYGWGDDGAFALSLGGFHPAFQPPASFPTLKRLTISISSSVAQLETRSYFALTANTLQFGARVELTAGGGSYNVHGWLGFDALCERHPLSFLFDLTAGVDLRHGSSVLASVHLDGHLSGPNPWHIAGEASLSLLFFDVTVHFDKTWGNIGGPLPLPDPTSLVLAALADRGSYAGALPPGVSAVVSLAGAPADAGEAVLVDPAATLRISQRVMPLGQPITRFAGAPLGRTVQLSIDGIAAFGNAIDHPTPTTEEFAPAQFFEFTDAQKLSLPSFGRFAGGVEIGGDVVDLGQSTRSRAVITPLQYDTTIVDSPTDKRPGRAYVLDAATQLTMSRSATPPGRGFGRYAPPVGARTRFDLQADRWVVAGVTDLALRADIVADGTKLGAQLALQRFLAENPDQQGRLQVVRAEEVA